MLTCSFTYFNVGGCVGRRPCVAAWLSGGRDPDGAVQTCARSLMDRAVERGEFTVLTHDGIF